MKLIHGLHFDNLRGDLYGGLTAAVVALPLALAIENVIRQSEEHGKPVLLCGLTPRVHTVLDRLGVLGFLPPGHVKDDRLAAIDEAAKATETPA